MDLSSLASSRPFKCCVVFPLRSKLLEQNKTNSENRHLVFLIFKKGQENDGVGDISSLFQRHCQTAIGLTMSLE